MSYKNYTDNDIIEKAKHVKSMSGLLKSLNKRPAGGNYANMKRKLQLLNIDTSHWTGQGWNAAQQLKDWSDYKRSSSAKPHLIKLRGYHCDMCGLAKWMGTDLTLDLDHIDGDRTNNEETNLRLLCPNCHSQTPTFRNSKRTLH